jgi:assimilatory nitrate reductase catalytic subunit
VVRSIRPDTVFIPYHWPGRRSANQLTISAQDPISKIPEYKVCAVRVSKAAGPPPPEPGDDALVPGGAGRSESPGRGGRQA